MLERRQRVLLIAPASLRDGMWRSFRAKHNLYVECKSYEEVSAGHHDVEWDQYAMIVVDESHAYRNPDTQRASSLREILKGSPPKQLVLLTATRGTASLNTARSARASDTSPINVEVAWALT